MKLYSLNGTLVDSSPKLLYRGTDINYKPGNLKFEDLLTRGNIPSKALLITEGNFDLTKNINTCGANRDDIKLLVGMLEKGAIDPKEITSVFQGYKTLNYYQELLYPTPYVSTSDCVTIGAKYSGWTTPNHRKKFPDEPILVFDSSELEGVDFRPKSEKKYPSLDREIGIFRYIPLTSLVQVICREDQAKKQEKLLKKYSYSHVQVDVGEIKSEFTRSYSLTEPPDIFYPHNEDEHTGTYAIPGIIRLLSKSHNFYTT